MASRPATGEWREGLKRGAQRSGAMAAALAMLALTLFLGLALATYAPDDRAWNTAAGGVTHNLAGVPGAWTADVVLSLFGPAIALLLPLGLIFGLRLWRDVGVGQWRRQLLGAALGIALVAVAVALLRDEAVVGLPAGLGGLTGMLAAIGLDRLIALVPQVEYREPVTWGLSALLAVGGLVLWARALKLDEIERGWLFRRRFNTSAEPAPAKQPRVKARKADAVHERPAPAEVRSKPVISDRAPTTAKATGKERQSSLALTNKYVLPPLSLLTPAPPSSGPALDKAGLERNARLLESVLDDFNVKGVITEVRPGPVVTMYELEPAAGIKASRVIQLADDVARNMSALSARVATIPGRSVIGIELPNPKRESVVLHELIASDAFEDIGGALPLVLGKNIAGDPVIADLAPMPHLLVAGTTGSGKSVGLNAMIVSLLYRLTPEQCRMIMIDPKMLELSSYEDIPHLLAPVVTEPAKAIRALKWAVEQMEDRYRMMASIGVRSLASTLR